MHLHLHSLLLIDNRVTNKYGRRNKNAKGYLSHVTWQVYKISGQRDKWCDRKERRARVGVYMPP